MDDSLLHQGLAIVCETCESEIDFTVDRSDEVGVCRQCGLAFLVEAPTANRLSG
jgi:hypothetical protein